MELTTIRGHNYTGLRAIAIDIPKGSRALLIAGPNGAGKTALIDAVRYALTGVLPRGLQYKKDVPDLITNGETEGAIAVGFTDDDGRAQTITVKLKTGNSSMPPPLGMKDASILSPQAFMALEPSKRRKVLYDWAGISLSISAVTAELQKAGHEEHHLARITTALKSGFEQGAKRAKELASEARGAWQATTGENYGSSKAADWKATVPEFAGDPAELKAKLDAANSRITKLAAIRDELQQAENQHEKAASSRKVAASLGQCQKELAAAIERRDAQVARIAALESETKADSAGGWTAPCPCCKEVLKSSKPGELVKYVPAAVDPATAIAAMRREQAKLDDMKRDVQACESAVRAAEAAALMLDNLPERPGEGELDKAIEDVRIAVEERGLLNSEYEAAKHAQEAAATAEEKTQRARGYHEDLVAFGKLEDAITALPATFLESALSTVNAKLGAASAVYGKPVQIGEDMELRLGPTRYGLLSRSQQWRVELALGMALAAGGPGIVLMDEFDLVQLSDRPAILHMIAEQSDVQVVLGATLKAAPALPDDMAVASVWLGKSE